MTADRRYTRDPCACGDPTCAGCEEVECSHPQNDVLLMTPASLLCDTCQRRKRFVKDSARKKRGGTR